MVRGRVASWDRGVPVSRSMGAEPEAIGRNVETERSARGGQLETERLARHIEYSFFNWNTNRKMGRTHRGHESPARPGLFQAPRALAAPEGGIQEPSAKGRGRSIITT